MNKYKQNISLPGKLFGILLIFSVPASTNAVAVDATLSATITQSLSLQNTESLRFGSVSAGSSAGGVTINTDGVRLAEGGVVVNSADAYSPARFIIEGPSNARYSISVPNEVVISSQNGETILVDNFTSDLQDIDNLHSSSSKELVVGGSLHLKSNQAIGAYSGMMVVEIAYS